MSWGLCEKNTMYKRYHISNLDKGLIIYWDKRDTDWCLKLTDLYGNEFDYISLMEININVFSDDMANDIMKKVFKKLCNNENIDFTKL